MSHFRIRPAAPSDFVPVSALLARAYGQLLTNDYPPFVLDQALPLIARARPELLRSGTYYVAEVAGHPVAVGGWTDTGPTGQAMARGHGHVRHVACDPAHLRLGHARAVLEHCAQTARAAGLATLHCLSTRTAVPFYSAMGFAWRGEIELRISPGLTFPAVQMQRHI